LIFVKKNGVWTKMASITDPPLRYMYIVVQCGLSSIIELIYVVDCVKCSV
jgi:hypothetical protein